MTKNWPRVNSCVVLYRKKVYFYRALARVIKALPNNSLIHSSLA